MGIKRVCAGGSECRLGLRGSRGGPADECRKDSSIDSVVEKQHHAIPERLHPLHTHISGRAEELVGLSKSSRKPWKE